MKDRTHGSVLILVLWVLFFLAALTVAVGTHVSATMRAGEYLWSRTSARALAEAGADMALAQVMLQTNSWDGVAEGEWNRDEEVFLDYSLGDGSFSIFFESIDAEGVIETNAGVIGENGKLNINAISSSSKIRAAFVFLLEEVGELSRNQAEDVATAVQAWISEDDERLTEQVGSGYYASLSPPYESAHDRMQSVAELRMVKGIGSELYALLIPYVTVYGSDEVNVNCASEVVLMAMAQACAGKQPDKRACETLAGKIVRFQRAGHSFESGDAGEMRRELSEFVSLSGNEARIFEQMMGSRTMGVKSEAFRGVSAGYFGEGSRATALLEFVVDVESGQFVYWYER